MKSLGILSDFPSIFIYLVSWAVLHIDDELLRLKHKLRFIFPDFSKLIYDELFVAVS